MPPFAPLVPVGAGRVTNRKESKHRTSRQLIATHGKPGMTECQHFLCSFQVFFSFIRESVADKFKISLSFLQSCSSVSSPEASTVGNWT